VEQNKGTEERGLKGLKRIPPGPGEKLGPPAGPRGKRKKKKKPLKGEEKGKMT